MKRKTLTARERAHEIAGRLWWPTDAVPSYRIAMTAPMVDHIRAAVRAALRKRDGNRAQETPIRLDVEALRKRRGSR